MQSIYKHHATLYLRSKPLTESLNNAGKCLDNITFQMLEINPKRFLKLILNKDVGCTKHRRYLE